MVPEQLHNTSKSPCIRYQPRPQQLDQPLGSAAELLLHMPGSRGELDPQPRALSHSSQAQGSVGGLACGCPKDATHHHQETPGLSSSAAFPGENESRRSSATTICSPAAESREDLRLHPYYSALPRGARTAACHQRVSS